MAALNPAKNLPKSMIGIFWADSINIHATISGTANINIVFLWPNFVPKYLAAKPPNIAPSPKIEAIHDPDSIFKLKG